MDAAKDSAVKIVTAIGADAEGAAGGAPHETFSTIVATLSPLAKDFTKTENQFSVEMAKQLAWIRSKDATGMMPLLNERMAECAARGVLGTAARDEYMASPARARVRFEATAAAAHAVVDGVAAGMPVLPRVNEGVACGDDGCRACRTWLTFMGGFGVMQDAHGLVTERHGFRSV